ncbi:hypothetical protein Tco_0438373 [Tanacetum coccineum]
MTKTSPPGLLMVSRIILAAQYRFMSSLKATRELIADEPLKSDQSTSLEKYLHKMVDEKCLVLYAIMTFGAVLSFLLQCYCYVEYGVHYELIRADGSSKRYSSMIRMLQGIDREDLEALWRIVKAKYGDTRPENEFERVLYGDLKVMFEPDIKSDVWRMLQGYRVTIWKLIDSSGVHFVRRNLKIQKMNIKFRGGLLGLKRLHGFLEVTAAQVHNGNYAKCQVKDNKIDLLVQQYEQFTILEEESIDSSFARFNTIITKLKSLDEGFSSKNYVRKFLRALHPKWIAKVKAIEESKDLSSLALDELIGNLKVHEVVMEKDSKIYKGKKERVKSIDLKAKKESSDDETLTSGSDGEEYALAVRNFKKFFRRKELKEKIKKLERSKEIDIACKLCQELKLENARLKETQVKFVKFDKSANSLR